MTGLEALGIVAGLIFIVLGGALGIRFKKLTSSKYFRIVVLVISFMLIAFGIYLAGRSIYIYG